MTESPRGGSRTRLDAVADRLDAVADRLDAVADRLGDRTGTTSDPRQTVGDGDTDLNDEGVRKVYVARAPTPDTLAELQIADATDDPDPRTTANTEHQR